MKCEVKLKYPSVTIDVHALEVKHVRLEHPCNSLPSLLTSLACNFLMSNLAVFLVIRLIWGFKYVRTFLIPSYSTNKNGSSCLTMACTSNSKFILIELCVSCG